MKRLRAAFHTNETQIGAVVVMTFLSVGAWATRKEDHPLWLLVACVVFWPTFAFFANLVSPIPKRRSE